MVLLSTLLHILLTIGKVLLIILLVILVLIALILCAPFCYRIRVKKDSETLFAGALVSWLLFVFRVKIEYTGDTPVLEVYVLGIPVMRILRALKNRKKGAQTAEDDADARAHLRQDGQTKEEVSDPLGDAQKREPRPDGTEKTEESGQLEREPHSGETNESAESGQQERGPQPGETNEPAESGQRKMEPQPGETNEPAESGQREMEPHSGGTDAVAESGQRESEPRPMRASGRRGCRADREQRQAARAQKKSDRRSAREQKREARSQKKAVRAKKRRALVAKVKEVVRLLRSRVFGDALQVVKQRGKKILRHVMPRRLKGFVRFGFDDPALTGQVSGILAMIYPKLPRKFSVTPEFAGSCLEADADVRGHIVLIYLLVQALRVLLNRSVRKLIRVVRKKATIEEILS